MIINLLIVLSVMTLVIDFALVGASLKGANDDDINDWDNGLVEYLPPNK